MLEIAGKMYLFIFESIGTSELILIGLVALIIFGPRKLPEMMKTFGKVMGDFKRSTNDFKESWEKEVAFENLEKETSEKSRLIENSVGRESYRLENEITAPQIKEIAADEFETIKANSESEDVLYMPENIEEVKVPEESSNFNQKRNWL